MRPGPCRSPAQTGWARRNASPGSGSRQAPEGQLPSVFVILSSMVRPPVLRVCGLSRRVARFGWEPSQPPSGGVQARDLVRCKAGVGGASGFPPFLFPLGFPLGAKRKGSVVRGTQRAFSSRLAGAGSPGFAKTRWLREGGGWSRSLGAALGPRSCGGGLGAAGPPAGSGPFPFRHGHFRSFSPEKPGHSGDVCGSFRRTTGDQTATSLSPFRQSSPFRHLCRPPGQPLPAGRFSSAYTRVGVLPPAWGAAPGPGRPNFAASPCESPRPGPLRRFAARKFPAPTSPLRPGKVRRFAVRKSHQTTRLFRFAASPWRSPTKLPGFTASPCRRSALRRGEGRGGRISGSEAGDRRPLP